MKNRNRSPFKGLKNEFGRLSLLHLSLYGMIITFTSDFIFNLFKVPFSFFQLFYFNPGRIIKLGEVWRILGIPFLSRPAGDFFSIIWFGFSMLIYYFVIRTLEARVGMSRANVFMVLSWIALAGYGFVSRTFVDFYPVILGITALAGLYNPEFTIYFYFLIPVKGKILGLIGIGLMIWNGIQGGYEYFLILALLLLLNYEAVQEYFHTRKRKGEYTKKIKKVQAKTKTIHRCEVCGRTEKDVPDMMFRYCSKCDGNFEYCEDHINNHEHRSNIIPFESKVNNKEGNNDFSDKN